MPIGIKRIIKRKAVRRQHKRRAIGPRQARAVQAIARRVFTKRVETKALVVPCVQRSMYGGSIVAFNPLYYMTQGSGHDQYVGSTLNNCKLHVRGIYKHTGIQTSAIPSPQYPWACSWLRIVVFKHPKEWRNGTVGYWDDISVGGTGDNITTTEIMRDPQFERMATNFRNSQECTFLFDKTYRCGFTSPHVNDGLAANAANTPNQAGAKYIDFQVNLGKVIKQAQSGGASGGLTKDNVYVAAMVSTPSPAPSSLDEVGQLSVDYLLSWKDA